MRFLPSLERKDAATQRATSSPYMAFGFPYYSNWSVERAVRDGFERVIWVYRAIDAIASNASRLPIDLRQGAEDGPEAPPQTINKLLNRKANPFESAAFFRYRLAAQLLLSKKGVFVEVVRDRAGRPSQLTLLPPVLTNPVPDRESFVSSFRVDVGYGPPQFIPALNAKGQPNVLWIRKPHPTDPYSGSTPMEAAGLSIDIDYYARLYNRTFLQNDGRPGGILGVKGEVDEKDAEEMKRRFSGGAVNAGRISVIETEHLSWIDTAVTPRDAQYVEGRKVTKEDILLAFGVPESVIGNASARTFDNADAERLIFWQETMLPFLDLLAGFYDYLSEGGIDDEVYVVHNTETVDVLQRLRRDREKHAIAMVEGMLWSPDEGREEVGKDPFDRPATRALYASYRLIPVAANDADAAELTRAPLPQAAAATAAADNPTNVIPPPGSPGEPAALPAGSTEPTSVAAALPPSDEVKRWAADVERTLTRFLDRQEIVVLSRLRGTKALKHTRYWDPARSQGNTQHWVGTKRVDVDYLLGSARWDSELAADLDPVFADMGASLNGDLVVLARDVNGKVREALEAAVSEADRRGDDLEGLAARVRTGYASVGKVTADIATDAVVEARGRPPFATAPRLSLVARS